jgi:predicted CoA-binding protein
MSTLKDAAEDFLAQKRIAVVGVSRKHGQAANIVYKRLRDAGYQVYPVNPNAERVEGDHCYAGLSAITDGVDAVVIATHPSVTTQIVSDCAALGIHRVWMHRSFGAGSVSDEAIRLCKEQGISVIPGACPMMFLDHVDVGHRCMRWLLAHTGGLPPAAVGSAGETAPAASSGP